LNVVNSVGVTQRLPFGGQLAATYLFGLTDQLRGAATDSYVQTSQLILSGTIPLLRGAGDIARENLIQTERDLVYAARAFEDFRRSFLVDISQEYFNLVQTQQEIANETEALELVRRTEQRTAALVAAGRLAEFEKNIASNEVLSRTATLASLRERYILALDRFKVRLGLGLDQAVKLLPEEFSIPDPQVTPEEAGVLALQYRLDLQTQRDQVEDSRRAVRNARNGLLPDLSLNGSVTMGNNDSRTFGDATLINPQSNVATAGATLTIPLDRTVETYNLRIATIGAQAAERSFGQARDNVVVDARSAVRNIELARFSLQIQERSVQIAERRAEEQELKRDEVTAQQIVETAQALSRARNARDRARTDLQFAILDYLLRTGQLRVSRDGTLERLPGMGERK
jgi:outer membrane protein TolC